jgi:hypothetical protein
MVKEAKEACNEEDYNERLINHRKQNSKEQG